jgi:hypothetical protein
MPAETHSQTAVQSAEAEPPLLPKDEEETPMTTFNDTAVQEVRGSPEETNSGQSKLHNCPKHLVKFLAQALDLNRLERLDYATVFIQLTPAARSAIKGLLEILQLSHKGKIKSTSKELLKIVFENGVEQNKKFKLLNNSRIRNFFEHHEQASIIEAKNYLRSYTVEKLLQRKSSFIGDSRIIRKDINERYVEIFIRELQEGLIRERISKTDKLRIFESCENF